MKRLHLYNTAHPLADTGKPIFIPFGEWEYDATRRQRLDRAHGERIANELNARVARGEPGIPVYQGHPDVPELASKYPDKGALGWVTKIEFANEGGKEGLALTVEWDRDPGKGFKWFSPYWFANEVERDGVTYIVSDISSIGLVNNPNIPEFRLANSVDANGREHVEAGSPEGGQFAPKTEGVQLKYSEMHQADREIHDAGTTGDIFYPSTAAIQFVGMKDDALSNRSSALYNINKLLERSRKDYHRATIEKRRVKHDTFIKDAVTAEQRVALRDRASLHRVAILNGFTYNRSTHQYE